MADFVYIYKTSDGVRHEAEIGAPSRDAAFAALRGRGIRPIKVLAKDGSRANGAVGGLGRGRMLALAGVVAALAAGAWFVGRATSDADAPVVVVTPSGPVAYTVAQPLARQPIPGDRSRIAPFPTNLFAEAAEVYLAHFAEPGRPPAASLPEPPTEAQFRAALAARLRLASTDFTEHVDLKRIVAGMKRELSAYLANGETSAHYVRELMKRQKIEIAYRERAEGRLGELLRAKNPDLAAAYGYWLKANAQLKSMGIYELPLPDTLRDYQMSVEF